MYVAVPGCAMIVAVIGVSGLTVTGIEHRFSEGTADFAHARLYAQSPIELGMLRIKNDPERRTTYLSGPWDRSQPIGTGPYMLEGLDPTDGDFTNDDTDPLMVTSIGIQGDDGFEPGSTLIGTPGATPGTDLETSFLQIPATFSNVRISDISRTNYCLVIRGGDAVASWADVYYAKNASDSGTALHCTEDSGASWDPRSNDFNKRDLRFSVWGRWAATGEQEIAIDRYFVNSTRIALRAGPNPSTGVETSVPVLNTPEVASP